ncbi:hypothetical protein [Pseudomonas graminis]
MALPGVGGTPQDMAAKGIQEQKSWDAVEKTEEDRKIAKQNATIANAKAIRY